MLFNLMLKVFSFLRYLYFCLDFCSRVGKLLDKKAKVDFKICDVTVWEPNNHNTHIAQYLKK